MEHYPKIGSKESELHLYPCSQTTQPACNIPGILLSVPSALQCTGHPGIIQGKL